MMFYFGANGNALYTVCEKIYQGSNKANDIYFFCPTSALNAIDAVFCLPSGTTTGKFPLSPVNKGGELPLADETGAKFNLWHVSVPQSLTEEHGIALVQFFITSSDGVIVSTATQTLKIEEGLCEYTADSEADAYSALRTEMTRVETCSGQAVQTAKSAVQKKVNGGDCTEIYAFCGEEQASVILSDGGDSGAAVRYKDGGRIYAGTPKENTDAVNKGYADKTYASTVIEDYSSKEVSLSVQSNTEYFYGRLDTLDLTFSSARIGDVFYITFKGGETGTTVTMNKDYVNLSEDITCLPESIIEISGIFTVIGWNLCWREI